MSSITANFDAIVAHGSTHLAMPHAAPQMDAAMVANFLLVLIVLLCLKEQRQHRVFLLGLALAAAALATIGLFQGTWALATVVGVGAGLALQRWQARRHAWMVSRNVVVATRGYSTHSRISHLFESPTSNFQELN
jgi:predicted branched-subunit amino acid permease